MENIFFHFSEVKNRNFAALRLGDKVSYILGRNEKGFCATGIMALSPEPSGNHAPLSAVAEHVPFLAYDDDVDHYTHNSW